MPKIDILFHFLFTQKRLQCEEIERGEKPGTKNMFFGPREKRETRQST